MGGPVNQGAASTKATYQGFACRRAGFTNCYGLSPGYGYADMPQVAFPDVSVADQWKSLSGSDGGAVNGGTAPGTSGRDGGASSGGAGGGNTPFVAGLLGIRGDLVLSRGARAITLKNLYIGDAGIEDTKRSAQSAVDRGFIRVPLVDVRATWRTRGDIGGSYNIPVSASGLPLAASTGTAPGTSDRSDRPQYRPESLRPDGKPFTLLNLVKLCLSRLNGNVPLVGSKAGMAAADGIIPRELRVVPGTLAVAVLEDLLQAWRFRFAFDPMTQTCAIWQLNDGALTISSEGGCKATSIAFPTATGSVNVSGSSLASWTRCVQPLYPPQAVRVVGQPIIREIVVDNLDAVGEIDGEIRPLAECVATFGMTIDDVRRWVMLPREAQAVWQVRAQVAAVQPTGGQPLAGEGAPTPLHATSGTISSEAVTELRRWAFKWFAIPKALRGLLPILPHRARSMADGTQRPPEVSAQLFDQVRFDRWEAEYQKELDAIASIAGSQSPALNADYVALQKFRDRVAQLSALSKTQLAASEQRELRLVNRATQRISPAAFEVTRDGVVKFNRLVGWIDQTPGRTPTGDLKTAPSLGLNDAQTASMTALIAYPRVKILFAYESTPQARAAAAMLNGLQAGPPQAPALDKTGEPDHYNYLGSLDGEKAKQLNPGGVDPANAASLYPRPIHMPWRQWIDIDGNTNRSELDAAAGTIAVNSLSGPQKLAGTHGESLDLHPLMPTGAIAAVEWEVTRRGAHTAWRHGLEKSIEIRQPTQLRIPGVSGISTAPGSVTNPAVNR